MQTFGTNVGEKCKIRGDSLSIGHIFHDLFHTSLCENPDYEVLQSIPIANNNACTWNIDSDHENK